MPSASERQRLRLHAADHEGSLDPAGGHKQSRSRAADQLHITQPAITAQTKALEESWELHSFTGWTATLMTPAGITLFRYVRHSTFDDIDLPQDPGYLRIQIGGENPRWVRVIDRCGSGFTLPVHDANRE